jgi:hypothetical protein
MAGSATIALSTSVLAVETTAQSSYPLKSEKAIPLGDISEYLSSTPIALAMGTTNAVAAIATTIKPAIRCAMVRVFLWF